VRAEGPPLAREREAPSHHFLDPRKCGAATLLTQPRTEEVSRRITEGEWEGREAEMDVIQEASEITEQ
jgi:hypothetical protein